MTLPAHGRLAPSPTGAQHLGNARTYLIAWLSARSQGGSVSLRIEDIDTGRNKPGAVEQAFDDLRWLGLDWDGEPVIQAQRFPFHQQALEELKRQELVYPCTCSRADIALAASAPHIEHENPTYPGTCSHRRAKDAEGLKEHSWRFRVTDSPAFNDLYMGEQRIDLRLAGGDFIVWRVGNMPAYQLAVVVDDAAAGVTEVVRGDDLLSSTPRQLLLYRALGYAEPKFAHVPLVHGPDGRRLAKRHNGTRVSDLRAKGIAPEAVIGLLAWSCGWIEGPRPIAAKELIPLFRWDTIPKERFQLTEGMLSFESGGTASPR
jgi:glutamyl-tRNA synthetase